MYVRSTNRNQEPPEASIGEACLVLRRMGVYQKVTPRRCSFTACFYTQGTLLSIDMLGTVYVHHAGLTVHADLSRVNTTLYIRISSELEVWDDIVEVRIIV